MLLRALMSVLSGRRDPPAPAADDLAADLQRAQEMLPGPPYTEILAWLHRRLAPRTYVEIGVASGKTIALAAPATQAIGIDPAPKIVHALGPNVRVFPMTSDAFFAAKNLPELLGGSPVDLAFIDGMHRFEYVLRDFAALEPFAAPGSVILAHDCYPLDRRTAERERLSTFWSGDCWRFVLALKKHRPDLAVHTIAAAPTGLVMIRRLDPASRVLARNMDAIVAEMLATDYAVLDADKPGILNLVPNDTAQLERLLA